MQSGACARLPGVPNDSGPRHVPHLLDHVELHEAPFAGRAAQLGQLGPVKVPHLAEMLEPPRDRAVAGSSERRLHATAAVVPADDDVGHHEDLHRVLEDREGVQVRGSHLVGDVAVDEDLARWLVDHLGGGDPAVRTPNPQHLGRLAGRHALEGAGVGLHESPSPGAVGR